MRAASCREPRYEAQQRLVGAGERDGIRMSWTTSLLVVVLVAAHVIAVESALNCFTCNSNRNGACGKEFKEDMATCTGSICVKIHNKDNGQ